MKTQQMTKGYFELNENLNLVFVPKCSIRTTKRQDLNKYKQKIKKFPMEQKEPK